VSPPARRSGARGRRHGLLSALPDRISAMQSRSSFGASLLPYLLIAPQLAITAVFL
jgi:sn-glycerol 3-phosphate transport system permease protein